MNGKHFKEIISQLNEVGNDQFMHHYSYHEVPMPSLKSLHELMLNLKKILFPGFFGFSEISAESLDYFIGSTLDNVYRQLSEQIKRGLCFDCHDESKACKDCEHLSKEMATHFIEKLPEIKHVLSTDVMAAYKGDPAAKSYGETIFCYPSISALTYHRIAHQLLNLGVPIIPRIISEISHSETGIDIHPGATIGESFFIDHGTGLVIGETCIIGKNVRVYQGVTLGAKSFPLDENGKPIKGIPRHPIVEDEVIIYSNATILGRITIGKKSVIGANISVTSDVPVGSKVL